MKAKAKLSRTFVVAAVVVVAVGVALFGVGLRSAEPQTTSYYYEVQDLGTFPWALGAGYGSYSTPSDINSLGHVVGVAGYRYEEGQFHAFLYEGGQMKDLGTLGGLGSSASAINDLGQVVGRSYTDYGWVEEHAFLYEDGQMKDLNPLMGLSSAANSYASDINDSGHIVGSYVTASGAYHAFLYKDGQMKGLNTLRGARAINDLGQVVGWSYTASGEEHAFLYDSTNGMKDLGTVSGGSNSWATDINVFEQIVGAATNDQSNSKFDTTAFLYRNEEMIDLETRLLPDDNGSVWDLFYTSAYGINDNGQIITEGWRQNGDFYTQCAQCALLLTPRSDIPPPEDTEAPSPPTITSPLNNSYDTDGSISVSGSAERGSTVELFEGTTPKGATKADSSSGAWSIALSGVSEGTHTYSAKATDVAGNTSPASDSVTVTVDKTAPTVYSVAPAEDATGVAPGVYVTATFSEDMLASSIDASFKLFKKGSATQLAASVSYDPNTHIAMLDPRDPLRRGATYKAAVNTDATDLAGNSLDQNESLSGSQQKVWFFKVRN
jgi:probable HAF family extracellular repeat protein